MSANAETQTPQQPVKKNGKRKSLLLLLTLLFIIIAVAYGIYWFLVLRHVEETDDAYVAGNQVQIMAQVSGSVTKVWADNTDFVKQGDVLVTLDQTDAKQAFEKAKTALASSVRQTHQLMINSKQLQASIEVQKTALAQAGLEATAVAHGDWSAVCGYEKGHVLLSGAVLPDAILVANDQMALGVLSAFHQQQLSIPGQKSVIGYDDTWESSFFYPALTTVSLDLDLQGKEAVLRLLNAGENEALRSSSVLPARLVIRNSTGPKEDAQRDLQHIAETLRRVAQQLSE